MSVAVAPEALEGLSALRERHRNEAGCQIVRYSILPRGLADAYAFRLKDRLIGYAGVWNAHFPDRLMEFYVLPRFRRRSPACCAELLRVSGATRIEAQTNLPQLHAMFEQFGHSELVENLLFEHGPATESQPPGVEFRRRRRGEPGPEGPWVAVLDGRVAGAGGILDHYNPPYCDVYMAVDERARRRGVGSYLVQELRRVAVERGMVPAARCNPINEASRRTLVRGGFVECGQLVSGPVRRG